jgi:cAMP-dependent protein kinase regulator
MTSLRDLTPAQYLALKNVKAFLHRLVASLLEARPESIERHVMTFLLTSSSSPSPSLSSLTSNPAPLPKAEATEAFPSYAASNLGQGAGKVLTPGQAPTSTGRRQSTISPEVLHRSLNLRRQPICSKMSSATEFHAKVIPKDESTFAALEATTRKVDLFSFLQDDQRRALVNAMFKKEYKDGENIIVEGDQPDNFYIIESGNCRIVKNIGGEPKEVAQLSSGQYFGELALISGSTRTATVIASGELTVCWAIDQVSYLSLLKEYHGQKRQRYRTLLKNVPFLKVLQEYEILLVADSLRPVTPVAGSTIVNQGDPGEDFYIILEGECVVLKSIEGGPPVEVARLKPGAYFGELALMNDCPRAASIIVASGNCKLISLDRKSFHRLLGPCNEIFKDNMKAYNTR